jgi:DNA polymerase III subunit beta
MPSPGISAQKRTATLQPTRTKREIELDLAAARELLASVGCDILRFAGDAKAERRRQLMSVLTGEWLPLNKCGVTTIEDTVAALIGYNRTDRGAYFKEAIAAWTTTAATTDTPTEPPAMPSTTERAPKAAANTKKAAAPTPPAPKPCLSFTATHAELSKAIEAAAALIASSSNAFPSMLAVLLESAGKTLKVSAMSGEASLSSPVPASIRTAGRALIPAATLAAALKALPAHDDVTITLDAGKATVKAGATSFKLLTLDPDEYPLFKDLGPIKAQFTIPQHVAHRLLCAGAFALPRKDHRRVLLGIFLEHMGGTTLRSTGTDGKQLARITVDADAASGIAWTEKETRGIVAPRCLIDHARRVLDPKPPKKDTPAETCILSLYEDGACLVAGESTFNVLAIGGKYPDCDQVIPRDFAACVQFSVPALLAACKRAGVTSDDKARTFVLHITRGMIRYESMSADLGTCEGEFPADYGGQPWTLAFNVDLLAEVLTVLGDVPAKMHVKTAKQPVIFTADKAPDLVLLLMPVKHEYAPAPAASEDPAD